MLQMIVTYEKETLKVVSALQVNTLISEANILKDSKYNVLITSDFQAVYTIGNELYLHKAFLK